MSPAGSSQAEEQQYLDKLKQLSKYIEPLRRMINKIDKNEDRKKDLSKMKSLLDILTDPSKRCPLKTLQKCEIALEKLKNDMAVVSGRRLSGQEVALLKTGPVRVLATHPIPASAVVFGPQHGGGEH